jgi:hypothetical protein
MLNKEGNMLKIGDEFVFNQEMYEKYLIADNPWKEHSRRFLGKKGIISSKRLDRFGGQTTIKWDNGEETNTYLLKLIKVEVEEAKFETLSIFECPEELLSEYELVTKELTLILMNKCEYSQEKALEKAESILDLVEEAMGEHGIVFYIP